MFEHFQDFQDFQDSLYSARLIVSIELTGVYVYRRFSEPFEGEAMCPDLNTWSHKSYVVVYSSELSMVVFILKGFLLTESNVSPFAVSYRNFISGEKGETSSNTGFGSLTHIIFQDTFVYHTYTLKPCTLLFENVLQFFIQSGVNICGSDLMLQRHDFRKLFIEYQNDIQVTNESHIKNDVFGMTD